MNFETINLKITRDGQYDLKENVKYKARIHLVEMSNKIDTFFTDFGR